MTSNKIHENSPNEAIKLMLRFEGNTRDQYYADIAPIKITNIQQKNNILTAVKTFQIPVQLDETQQYLIASLAPLALEQSARTRQELEEIVHEELDFLWRNIATAPDSTLSPGAKRIKVWLREHFNGDINAAQ